MSQYDSEKCRNDEKQKYQENSHVQDHDAFWAAQERNEQYDRFIPVFL